MKKTLILNLLLTISAVSVSIAQNSTLNKPVAYTIDTIYYDQDFEKTPIKEDIKYARIIKRTSNGKPYGTVRDYYYPNWAKQWEGKLLSESPDVCTGICTFWYPNGKMQSTGTYINNESQADLQNWKEDGSKVVCNYKYADALPITKSKLHSNYNTGSSRQVIPVEIPEDALGLVYKIDIRDEEQPPITWTTAASLTLAAYTGGTSTMLMAGAKAMNEATMDPNPPTVNTKCHFYITPSLNDAQYFINSKGSLPSNNYSLRNAENITKETRSLEISPSVKTLYFCINNDNLQTSAQATLSVSVLKNYCE